MTVQVKQRAELKSPASTRAQSLPKTGMLALWSMRQLLFVMVNRNLLGRYRGSVMGFFWTIINPLGHLLLYTFVFSVILKVRFGHDAGTANFALYLMAGLLPWGALSESLMLATSSITEQPNLVKRVVFPLEILPLAVVVSAVISEIIGILILGIVVAVVTHQVQSTILFLPLILISQVMFIAGLSWLLGSLGVYLQDLRHVMSLALSVWMYGTPIVYPASAFPHNFQFLLWMNPMAGIVTDYRRVLLEGKMPDWQMFAVYTSIAVLIWCVGYFFFVKTKRSFADVM